MAATTRLSSIACGLLVALMARSALCDEPAPATVKPKPLVTISKETTFITEPLRPDGYPDYLASLDAKCSQGVTPDNNAAVLLVQAVGPHQIKPELRDEFFKKLGIPRLSNEGRYFIDLKEFAEQWENKHPEVEKVATAGTPLSADDETAKAARAVLRDNGFVLTDEQYRALINQETSFADLVYDQMDLAMQAPWSASDYPVLAAWLDANEQQLKLAVQASQRPKYFDPPIRPGAVTPLMSFFLPDLGDVRAVCKALLARAMRRINEGKIDEGRDDLLASHRWARLVNQGPTLVHALVAIAIESWCCKADQNVAIRATLTNEQLAGLKADIAGLPPLPPIADTIDTGERLFALDAIISVACGGPKAMNSALAGKENRQADSKDVLDAQLLNAMIDWDEVLRTMNGAYDRLVAACRITSLNERKAAFEAFEAEIQASEQELKSYLVLKLLFTGRAGRGRQMAKMFSVLLMPAISMVVRAQDRIIASEQLTQVVFALAAYRAEHGKYPGALAELAPAYLKELPRDFFTDADFVFKPERDGGYLLYSVGPNGRDDGGRDRESAGENDDPDQLDDIVVRAPAPPT